MKSRSLILPLSLATALMILSPIPTLAYHQPSLTVQILSTDGTLKSSFDIATANQAGGAKLAVTDLGTDGVPEIIVGNGLGNEPRVTVYRTDGSTIGSFLAYDQSMGIGITIAACDINGDGTKEIVTGTQYGAGPHIRTFDNVGNLKHAGFFAYNEAFRGGVNISCGDLDGDGQAELVTSPGPSGGPHVKVWKFSTEGTSASGGENNNWRLHQEFFPFAQTETGGVITTIADAKLFVTLQRTSGNHIIKSYVIHSSVETSDEQENHTATTSSLFVSGGHVIATALEGGYIAGDTIDFAANVPFGSVTAATGDVDQDGAQEIIAVGDRPLFTPSTLASLSTDQKSIVVDLSEQRLYAYENGIFTNSFLISSGKTYYETTPGTYSVLAKLPYVYYAGTDLDGTRWDLGNVPWNLRIYPHHYIHYAYWHNNFGHPMSHGCVNVNLTNMKWIYDWANVGVPVIVQE